LYTRFALSILVTKNPQETSLEENKGFHFLKKRYEKCYPCIIGCRSTIEIHLRRGPQSQDLQIIGVIHSLMLSITEYWMPDEDPKGKNNFKKPITTLILSWKTKLEQISPQCS